MVSSSLIEVDMIKLHGLRRTLLRKMLDVHIEKKGAQIRISWGMIEIVLIASIKNLCPLLVNLQVAGIKEKKALKTWGNTM